MKEVLREAVRTERRLLLFAVVMAVCVGVGVWWHNYYPLTDKYTGQLHFSEESACGEYVSSVVLDENLDVERLDVERLIVAGEGGGFIVLAAVCTDEGAAYMGSRYGLSPYEITAGIRSGLILASVFASLVGFAIVFMWVEDRVSQRKQRGSEGEMKLALGDISRQVRDERR